MFPCDILLVNSKESFEAALTRELFDVGVGKGTRPGLATVQSIVTRSGGSVTVDSEVGKGTSFTVYLPQADVADGVIAAQPPEARPPVGAQTVLVVEDAQDFARLPGDCWSCWLLGAGRRECGGHAAILRTRANAREGGLGSRSRRYRLHRPTNRQLVVRPVVASRSRGTLRACADACRRREIYVRELGRDLRDVAEVGQVITAVRFRPAWT
jgi:Histidine kinase-, DNA gyrase B-, and HSP90-like ATPase